MKICNQCGIKKDYLEFQKKSQMKDGYNSKCKKCIAENRESNKERHSLYGKKWRNNNKKRKRNLNKKYYLKNINYFKKYNKDYRSLNKESFKLYKNKYDSKKEIKLNKKVYNRIKYLNDRDYILQRNKKYRDSNRAKFNHYQNKRRCLKLKATPVWANLDKIQILYEKCKWLQELTGHKYHVDHIIPLNHEKVCGLHVWHNLQILEESLNKQKSNVIEEFINAL